MAKRRPGGFGGPSNVGNPNQMMKQLQQMQENMAKAQEALSEEILEVSAGGGAVTVVITGHQRIREIRINKDALDTTDAEWAKDLQDLLVISVNQAIEQSQQRAAERMEAVSGGLSDMLPGGLGDMLR
jgi:nucleoid-associated protein EbfC